VHAWVYRRNWKEKVNSTEQYGGATDSIPLRLMQTADAEIKIALQTARLALQNSGNKGDHVEGAIRSILERFLPRNLYVGHGEVVDTLGVQSSQSDVVIANDLQPFRLASEVPGLYLVEGVSAVGEIKARLTTAELNDSIRKGTRSKSLRFRAHTGATVSSNTSDLERFYFSPPFFLVAVESEVAVHTLLDRLASAPAVPSSEGNGPNLGAIDAAFILGKGVAINYGDGQGAARMRVNGAEVTGWVYYDSNTVLAELVLWLHRTMPRLQMPFSSPVNAYDKNRPIVGLTFPTQPSN
jgi:hypothetical protein